MVDAMIEGKIEIVCRALCAANREEAEWMVLPGVPLQTRSGKHVAMLHGVEPMPLWRTYWNEAVEVLHALGLDEK